MVEGTKFLEENYKFVGKYGEVSRWLRENRREIEAGEFDNRLYRVMHNMAAIIGGMVIFLNRSPEPGDCLIHLPFSVESAARIQADIEVLNLYLLDWASSQESVGS